MGFLLNLAYQREGVLLKSMTDWLMCSFYTLAECIILLSLNVWRIEGGITDPIKYIYSWSVRLSVCPFFEHLDLKEYNS